MGLDPAWFDMEGFPFPTASDGCPIIDCVHCAAEVAEKERKDAIDWEGWESRRAFSNFIPRSFRNVLLAVAHSFCLCNKVPLLSRFLAGLSTRQELAQRATSMSSKPDNELARIIQALFSLIMSLLGPVLLLVIGTLDLRFGVTIPFFGKVSRELASSRQQKTLPPLPFGAMGPSSDEGGRSVSSIEASSTMHQSLAGLDLYEATIRPDETQEFIGVLFNTRTKQWSLAHRDGEPCEQIKRIKARDKQVLLLCSDKLVRALALGAVGKSTILVEDYKGVMASSHTTITALACGDGIPRFQGGELSQLRLSSQDVFDIYNFKEFLLHAKYNIKTILASSRGQFMKSWLVTLPQLLDITKHGSTYAACKEAFWELYNHGSVCNMYLSVPDRIPSLALANSENAEVSHVADWLQQQGTANPMLRAKVEMAVPFFSDPLSYEAGMDAVPSPFLYIISPRATAHAITEGSDDSFCNVARHSVARPSPPKATTMPRRRKKPYPPGYPDVKHPMAYPQRPEPERSLTDWEAGWHKEVFAAERREQRVKLLRSTSELVSEKNRKDGTGHTEGKDNNGGLDNGTAAPTKFAGQTVTMPSFGTGSTYHSATVATTHIPSDDQYPSIIPAPSTFALQRSSTPSAITFEETDGLSPAHAPATEYTASSSVTTPIEARLMTQLDSEREHGDPPPGTSFARQFEAADNARRRLEEMGMVHEQETDGILESEDAQIEKGLPKLKGSGMGAEVHIRGNLGSERESRGHSDHDSESMDNDKESQTSQGSRTSEELRAAALERAGLKMKRSGVVNRSGTVNSVVAANGDAVENGIDGNSDSLANTKENGSTGRAVVDRQRRPVKSNGQHSGAAQADKVRALKHHTVADEQRRQEAVNEAIENLKSTKVLGGRNGEALMARTGPGHSE